jgi:hypothetical protein
MMKKSEIVFALYKPHAGKDSELEALINRHVPTLQEYGLVTSRMPIIVKSKNGTYIEVFEWASKEAIDRAHQHPGVASIWEAMGKVSQFTNLSSLEEAGSEFAHFQPIN